MSSVGPEGNFDPEDHVAPRSVRSEANVRSSLTPARSNFDEMLQEAIRQSMRHPLESERERSSGLYGVAGFAAGIGVSAIIAVIFFILIPRLSPSTTPQPAVSETTSTIATPGEDKTTPEESEALLRKFMQWQQKK
jgi:hypothetical protein